MIGVDVLIPLVIGLAMVVNPALFYRTTGEPTPDERSRARFQKIGYVLVAAGFCLMAAKLLINLGARDLR